MLFVYIVSVCIFLYFCRWEQNTAETEALMKKAQGDWNNLSVDEFKRLYRHRYVCIINNVMNKEVQF